MPGSMSNWRANPPTYAEWLAAKNRGYWWIRFRIMKEEVEVDEDGSLISWPEAWHSEIVQLTATYQDFRDIFNPDMPGRLRAHGGMLRDGFYLDEEDKVAGLFWQPVASALDDDDDQSPCNDG